ncbi:chemokine vCXCL1 [Human betaherpesvirus 5]|uniref:UL146 n=1 Tax=Human cytomegalovirus TaxID=10359 RepID=Q6SWE9_HCMV|nr:UL146 [Human betaherpesvirus 5]ACD35745.1 alpha-chemokine UL146 [Human betaherpesvirus 5]AKI15029.1 chemokine vCXCL1 [Human betaherpesvirus 5]AKI24085.1 chemokine vCXCL1 [Human betaherpesvirus 5]AMO64798.1 chemokine vCXCL1 [Human betaherpesvirus 5]
MRFIFGLLISLMVAHTCNAGLGSEGNGRCTCVGYHRFDKQLPRGTIWLGHRPPGPHCPRGDVLMKLGEQPTVCLSDHHPLSKWMYRHHGSDTEIWFQIEFKGPQNTKVVSKSFTPPS